MALEDQPRAKVTKIKPRGAIHTVAFTCDGRHIVGGGTEGTIRRWNVENGVEVGQMMKATSVNLALAVSKDGRWIASGDSGYKIILWNAATRENVLEITGHTGNVVAVDISGDSTRIASGAADKTARIFDLTSGKLLIGPLYHDNVVSGVQLSPDGTRFATATVDYASVRIYDAHSGAKLFDIHVLTKNYTTKPLSWSPDGQQLFAASSGKINCFNISTFLREEWSTQNNEVRACITTERVIICSAGSSVSFWDTISHEQIGRLIKHPGTVANIAVSSDSRYLACVHGSTISVHSLCDVLPQAYLNDFVRALSSHLTGDLVPSVNSLLLISVSQIPLMHLSDAARESWMQNELSRTETILSEEISQSEVSSPYALVNRALVRARSGQWDEAICDANESLRIKPSPIGYIAKALTFVGKGEQELALEEFDYVFHACDQSENTFLLLIKAIFLFVCGKCCGAISRVQRLIATANRRPRYCYQVLGNMYLKQGDYERVVQTFENAESLLASSDGNGHLVAISLMFGWSFEGLEFTAWKCLCKNLYAAGRVKEFTETLSRMVDNVDEDKKEAAHGRVLEEIVASSGEVTMLAWTGRSSSHNSCLPSSPDAYAGAPFTSPIAAEAGMKTRTAELRKSLSPVDVGIIYGRVTGLPPVRFANFRLHLPCIVFPVKSIGKDEDAYQAKVVGLGDVEFRTGDPLSLKEPRELVFVNPWIRDLEGPSGGIAMQETIDSERGSNEDLVGTSDVDAELVRVSIVEEVPQAPSDEYTRALQLVTRLGQPFTALLLLKQPGGAFKRVAADHEIVVSGLGSNVPKDIRAEVLEIL